jgi:putative NADH-flavin reductase
MVITVFGATGMVGKQVVQQALANGHTVKAFGRNVLDYIDKDLHDANFEAIQGHVFDAKEVLEAVKNADAVISVLGGEFDGLDKTRSLGIKNIIEQMQQASIKRIIALGGLGVLPDADGNFLLDSPDYPSQFKPVGKEHAQAYLYLLASKLDWTFICSPNIIDANKTEQYITEIEGIPTPNLGEITAGDLADCMLKAITKNDLLQQRVGISKL